jgi:hypothetical protein
MTLLGFPRDARERISARWRAAGALALSEFAPYFRHVFFVELFFYLGIAADLIGPKRPSNKVDLAYLYYLPFCKIFSSGDDLHARVAPLFLRDDQSFVHRTDLKAGLGMLDEYFSSFPEEIKKTGVVRFAEFPPTDPSFFVTQLWDRHAPNWREQQAEPQIVLAEAHQRALKKLIDRFTREAQRVDPETPVALATADFVHMEGRVLTKKGKWSVFPPEVMKAVGSAAGSRS